MKTFYTLSFFADMLLLILLVFKLLKLTENGSNTFTFCWLSFAVTGCLILLVHLLLAYIKLPSRHNK